MVKKTDRNAERIRRHKRVRRKFLEQLNVLDYAYLEVTTIYMFK